MKISAAFLFGKKGGAGVLCRGSADRSIKRRKRRGCKIKKFVGKTTLPTRLRQAPPCKGETRNERSLSIAGDVQAKSDGIFLPILPCKGGCRTGAGGSQTACALSSVLLSCLSAGCPILRFLQCGYMRSNVSKSLTNAHKKTMIVSRSNAKQGRNAMPWIGGA